MWPSPSVDVAIVGAGAAGIAAANALYGQELSVLIVEARERIGGRALTRRLPGGLTFDVGCEWLHSADQNDFVTVARKLGFELACSEPRWGEQSFDINFPRAEQDEFHAAYESFEQRLEVAAALPHDTVAADWLEPGGRWNALIDAVSTYVNGTELSNLSVHDTTGYCDTGLNWRLPRGYGTLVAALGASCDVVLNTEVSRIDHSASEIMLETSRGNLGARAVICTVPTNLIVEEALRFWPPLPEKIAAAAGLPLGYAEKAMLYLDEPGLVPAEGHLFGATDRTQTGSYDLRPFGRPCIEAFFGGALARGLAKAGALTEFAIEELVFLLGSDVRGKLHPVAASAWTTDRLSRGSYSHARPGCAAFRSVLAAPVNDRLFFAGEATSHAAFSTAHGAYASGLRAAAEVTRGLHAAPLSG